jgi:hypothetical protein
MVKIPKSWWEGLQEAKAQPAQAMRNHGGCVLNACAVKSATTESSGSARKPCSTYWKCHSAIGAQAPVGVWRRQWAILAGARSKPGG